MDEGENTARRLSQWLEMKNLHPLSQDFPDLK